MRAPGYIRHKTARGYRTCCVLLMLPYVPHNSMCTTLGRFFREGDFHRRRGLYIKEVQPQDSRSIKFFQDRPLPCLKHVGATETITWWRNRQEPLPTGLWKAVATTTSRPPSSRDVSVSARGGSADPARTSTKGAAPTTPPGGVIDCMRQGSIVGSVGQLHWPGLQRSRASAGQQDRPEGEDQLGPTTSHLGQCRRRTFQRTRRTNQMCSTNQTCSALLTCYAFGDDTIGSREFITAVTRTAAGPRPFGARGAGL